MTLPIALDTNLLEPEWVLRGAYRLERGAVIAALDGVIAIRQVHFEQEYLVRQALAWHQQGLDFAAALHLLRSDGCARFATSETTPVQ
jgi:predicted nucleic-acid-binding protein